ncbi:putative solute:Na symporter [Algibacter lectus]|uniref:Putative solute:Na symporter n=1 Tax=Algibacter lectus TaxID=221126 RepID=A0A090WRM0_9FLAO|nr:putative solute:Na symporter [Algibacter lectus]
METCLRGLDTLTTALPEKFDIIGGPDSDVPFWTLFTGMVILNFYYWGTNQAIIQRALGAKNLKEGQKGLLIAAFIKILGPIIVVLPGIIAYYIFNGDLANADEAYPMLVKKVLPVAYIGFFAAVLFGAILSSFNSALNSSVTLFGLDFYKEYINKEATELQVVKAGKIFGIILAIFSIGIAPLLYGVEGGIFTYLQQLNGTHSVPILAIVIVGVFSKRVSGKAANIAILISVVTYLVTLYGIEPDISFLHLMGILFVLTVVVMFVISYFIPRETDFVQEYTKQVDITNWRYLKPVGAIVVALVIALYVAMS